jgi:hypothetical protein
MLSVGIDNSFTRGFQQINCLDDVAMPRKGGRNKPDIGSLDRLTGLFLTGRDED